MNNTKLKNRKMGKRIQGLLEMYEI